MRRTRNITLAILAPLVVAGGIVQGCQAPAEGDCDIAADMMTYRKTTGDEISSVKDKADDMDDPNGFILKKYDEWQTQVPKYVEQIKAPDIKARAQAVSDSDAPLIEWHKGLIANPPDFSDPAWRDSNDAKLKQITDRIGKATDDLKQACPNIHQ